MHNLSALDFISGLWVLHFLDIVYSLQLSVRFKRRAVQTEYEEVTDGEDNDDPQSEGDAEVCPGPGVSSSHPSLQDSSFTPGLPL
jgi:hypothetical protein